MLSTFGHSVSLVLRTCDNAEPPILILAFDKSTKIIELSKSLTNIGFK